MTVAGGAEVTLRLTLEELAERAELVNAARMDPDPAWRRLRIARGRSKPKLVDQIKESWRRWAEKLSEPRD